MTIGRRRSKRKDTEQHTRLHSELSTANQMTAHTVLQVANPNGYTVNEVSLCKISNAKSEAAMISRTANQVAFVSAVSLRFK